MRKLALALFFVALAAVLAGLHSRPARGADTVTLTLWDRQLLGEATNSNLPRSKWFITQAIQRFEKANPGIAIKYVQVSGDIATADNQFRAASIARNGPDIATQFAGGDTISFGHFAEPLDRYFSPAERRRLIGWFSVREDFKPNGSILALPYGAGSYFEIMYNKKLLRKAGVTIKHAPRTWEAFLALCAQVKKRGITPVVLGNQEGYTGAWVISALAGGQFGTDGFFQMRSKQRKVSDAAMVRAYDEYHELYARGYTNPDAGSLTNGQGQQAFIRGKGAFFIQGGWFNADAVRGLGASNVGEFPIPQMRGCKVCGAMTGGPNVAIMLTNYSRHKPEAIKFLKFMARPDILDLYVKVKQTEPSNNVAANTSLIQNPLLRSQARELKHAKEIYPFDNIMASNVNDLFYRINASVFTGKQSVTDALSQLQREVDSTH